MKINRFLGYTYCDISVNEFVDYLKNDFDNKTYHKLYIPDVGVPNIIAFNNMPRVKYFFNCQIYQYLSNTLANFYPNFLRNSHVINPKNLIEQILKVFCHNKIFFYFDDESNKEEILKCLQKYEIKKSNIIWKQENNDIHKQLKRIESKNIDILFVSLNKQNYIDFISNDYEDLNIPLIIDIASFTKKKCQVSYLKTVTSYYLKRLKKKLRKPKNGFVAGWHYIPQTTAQAISTFKILKNSKFNYDVFTSSDVSYCYNNDTYMNEFDLNHINVIYSDVLNQKKWCLKAAKYYIDNYHKYDFFMTRIMPSFGHDVGLEIKKQRPTDYWIASFSDPLYNSPYSLARIAYANYSKPEANKILKDYLQIFEDSDDKFLVFQELKEMYNKNLKVCEQADLLVFNNLYQAKWMLGGNYEKYKYKIYILPHSFDSEFYLKLSPKYDGKIKFLFSGHTDEFRNLRTFIEAINNIKINHPKELEKIDITLVGDFYEENYKLLQKYKLMDKFKIVNKLDYIKSLDMMNDYDVLLHIDASFDFMNDLNVYFASKISDYLGVDRLILSLSTEKGIIKDIMEETNNVFCHINDIDEIENKLLLIIKGKIKFKKSDNTNNYNSKVVIDKFDKYIEKDLNKRRKL